MPLHPPVPFAGNDDLPLGILGETTHPGAHYTQVLNPETEARIRSRLHRNNLIGVRTLIHAKEWRASTFDPGGYKVVAQTEEYQLVGDPDATPLPHHYVERVVAGVARIARVMEVFAQNAMNDATEHSSVTLVTVYTQSTWYFYGISADDAGKVVEIEGDVRKWEWMPPRALGTIPSHRRIEIENFISDTLPDMAGD